MERATKSLAVAAYGVGISYFLFTMFIPIQRLIGVVWPGTVENTFAKYFNLLPLTPLLMIALLMAMWGIEAKLPRTKGSSDGMYIFWMIPSMVLFFLLLTVGMAQDLTKVPVHPFFAIWRGACLGLAIFMLLLTHLRSRLRFSYAWVIGVCCPFIMVGLWESVYQTCNYHLVYTGIFPIQALYNEWKIELPYLVIPIPLILCFIIRYRKSWTIGYPTLLLAIATIGTWTAWIGMGYWIEVFCDFTLSPPMWIYNNPIDITQLLLGRSSKVLVGLTLMSLVWGLRDEKYTTG